VTVQSLAQDERDAWRTIRKELEDIGISVAAFDANKDFIMEWFQRALLDGAFEEQAISDSIDANSIGGGSVESSQGEPDVCVDIHKEHIKTVIPSQPVVSGPRLPSPTTMPSDLPPLKFSEDQREDEPPIQKKPGVIVVRPRSKLNLFIGLLRGYNDEFIEACFNKNLGRAQQLLDKGANINATYTRGTQYSITPSGHPPKGVTALGYAASEGSEGVASWLLQCGADVNLGGDNMETPLHMAIWATDKERMIRLLLAHGAEINRGGRAGQTPLWRAMKVGGESAAELLLQNGASPNCQNWGQSVLGLAIKTGSERLVTLLLNYHAEVNGTAFYSPLVAAVLKDQFSIVGILMKYGAQANLSKKYQKSPLAYAVEKGHIRSLQVLLECGADVNYSSRPGYSAISVAVQSRQPLIVRTLLDYGADFNAVKIDGESLLDYAAREKMTEIEKMLIDAGARPEMISSGN